MALTAQEPRGPHSPWPSWVTRSVVSVKVTGLQTLCFLLVSKRWDLRDCTLRACFVHLQQVCKAVSNFQCALTKGVHIQSGQGPTDVGEIRRESRTGEVKLDVLSHYCTSQTLLGWETGMGDRRAAGGAKGTWRSRTHSCSQAAQSHLWALSTSKLSSV